MALQPLIMPILSIFKSAGITQARSALLGLNKDFTHFAQSVGKAGGAFAAFQALAGAREFTITAVEATQRFERNILALQQVFEEVTPQLRAFTKEVENYGLSQSQAAQASVFLGSVLKQYGFSAQESADQTERLVTLAQDLATTYGYDVQEALLAITALFRGEFDPIEKFGVAMKQNEINARLAAEGLGDLEGEALNYASAQTRLTMLFERAGDSVGAYSRAINTLYGAQQQLGAVIGNLQVAFGAPLQEPIAQVINSFTQMAQKYGPEVVEIGEAIGVAIENVAPFFAELSETFFLLIAPLETVVRGIGTLAGLLSQILTPILNLVNAGLEDFNLLLTFLAIKSDEAWESLGKTNKEGNAFLEWLNEVLKVDETLEWFDSLPNSIRDAEMAMQKAVDFSRNNEFTEASRDAAMLDNAVRNFAKSVEATAEPLTYFENNLRLIGTYSKDAEGKLTGLAQLFVELEEAANKSKAAEALEKIGFEASQIEEILTRPDWMSIFREISRAAEIALLPMGEAIARFGAGVYFSAVGILSRIKTGLTKESSGVKTVATDFIKEFFDGIDEEVAKQEARVKLERMGASEGLIDAILGSQGWEKVLARVVKNGISGLKELQSEFNRTAAGIKEVTAATKELEEAQRKALEAAQDEIDKNVSELQRLADEAEKAYEKSWRAASAWVNKMQEVSKIDILPNAEEQIGKFESAVIGSMDRIKGELKTAFQDRLIFQRDFDAISAWAEAEEFELRRIAQLRDDLATRFSLSDALIKDYKRALTSGLQLTTLLSAIKTQTEKRTVTEMQSGMMSLTGSMKQFAVSISRSYEETIENTASKSETLLDGFRNMAEKARDFGENLRKLRAMGLDPMLFDQLVQAGVVAGGETAQALVDGGAETITEINGLFQEINAVGASLGEEVASTLYGSGIDMVDGLLAGIRSQQEQLLATARAMGEAFSAQFNSRVSIATGIATAPKPKAVIAEEEAIKAAEEFESPLEAAAEELVKIEEEVAKAVTANAAALAQIDELIGGAYKALGGKLPSAFVPGIQQKLGAFEALRGDILSGAVQDISGLTKGMSSADVKALLTSTGGETVNNYYVTVEANNRLSGSKAGEGIVEALQTFSNQNGNFQVSLGV